MYIAAMSLTSRFRALLHITTSSSLLSFLRQPTDPSSDRDANFWAQAYAKHAQAIIATRTERNPTHYWESGRADTQRVIDHFLGPAIGGRLLEIGCGPGRLTTHLADHFARIVALDLTPELADICATELQRLGIHHVQVVVGSAKTLPTWEDHSFQAILSYLTLQHISDSAEIERYIDQASRLLSEGGVAALQLRRPGIRARLTDWCGWIYRRAQGLPTLAGAWRGTRPSARWLKAVEGNLPHRISAEYQVHDRHLWLVLHASQRQDLQTQSIDSTTGLAP